MTECCCKEKASVQKGQGDARLAWLMLVVDAPYVLACKVKRAH